MDAATVFVACQEGHVDAARLLLDKGAEVDQKRHAGHRRRPSWRCLRKGAKALTGDATR